MIRRAVAADLPALLALEAACFPDAWPLHSLQAELAAGHGLNLVVEQDSLVVASLLGWLLADEVQINRVAVLPQWQQHGLGQRLLVQTLQLAQRAGATQALLEVRRDNLPALALYRRQGFVSAGVRRGYYADGCDALVLTRELATWRHPLRPGRLQSGVYALVDGDRLGVGPAATAAEETMLLAYGKAAIDTGAVAVQLRLKSLPLGHGLRPALATALLEYAPPACLVVIDDALAAVNALPAHLRNQVGLHLGQSDTPIASARALLGEGPTLGLSTHTLRQVAASRALPCDYLGFGPIHATTGKANPADVTGVHLCAAAAAAADVPLVAIGGLTEADLAPLVAGGVTAAAVLGAWLGPAGQPHTPAAAAAALGRLVRAWQVAAARVARDELAAPCV
jgi:ribosomal-protein-alanine acetyltransferase